jgi:DNA-binding beta-propeller fold protein YncE
VIVFARTVVVLTVVCIVSSCASPGDAAGGAGGPPAADASPARPQLVDGRWDLRVDRAWDRSGGQVVFPSDPLQESDYRAVTDGPIYPVTVSDGGNAVTVGDAPMTGERAATTDGRTLYHLTGGTFAGGRLVVWTAGDGLQAELTIYGSGVPIVQSERGALTPHPWSTAVTLPMCLRSTDRDRGGRSARAAAIAQADETGLPDRYLYSIGNGNAPGRFTHLSGVAAGPEGTLYLVSQDAHHILTMRPDMSFVGLWGGPGTAQGRFSYPASVAVGADGTVYVADLGNSRIEVFDRGGRFLAAWDGYPRSDYPTRMFPFTPIDVTVAPDGTVLVVDSYLNQILAFDRQGTLRTRWNVTLATEGPSAAFAAAVDDRGRVLVVLNGARLRLFDLSGTILDTWRLPETSLDVAAHGDRVYLTPGTGDIMGLRILSAQGWPIGQIPVRDPTLTCGADIRSMDRITIASDGSLYVIESAYGGPPSHVLRLSAVGACLHVWSGQDASAGVLDPADLSTDADQRLYVADTGHGRVQVFGAAGEHEATWGGEAEDTIDTPVAIVASRLGTVYVSDQARGKVLGLDATGHLKLEIGAGEGGGPGQFGSSGPGALGFTGLLSAWPHLLLVADPDNARVQILLPDGTYRDEFGTPGDNETDGTFCAGCLRDLTTDSGGDVHVTDVSTNQRVQVFDFNGKFRYTYHGLVGEDSRFAPLSGIAYGVGGRVYLADPRGRIQVFDRGGLYLTEWDTVRVRPGMRIVPDAITTSSDGTTLFVGDRTNGRIHVFGRERADTWRLAFHDNAWVTDRPVYRTTTTEIAFDWAAGAPAAGVPADGFSMSAQRFVDLPAGRTPFTVRADGAVRLWVDDTLLIDDWRESRTTRTAEIDLAQGQHFVELEFADFAGPAWITLETGTPRETWTPAPGASATPTPLGPARTPSAIPRDRGHNFLPRTDASRRR